MKVSDDIKFISKNGKHLIYNYELNKAIFVNSATLNAIKTNNKLHYAELTDCDFLSQEDISNLVHHGVIIDSLAEYDLLKYSHKLENRNPEVKILAAYFHVTQMCNLSCSYCYNKENLIKKEVLTSRETELVLDKLKEVGTGKLILTGGEPLLRSDIETIVINAKARGFSVEILTNGMLLNKHRNLFELVDSMIVSLDTLDQATNQRIGLDIPHVLNNLRSIPIENRHKVFVRSVISKSNSDDWKKVKQIVKDELNIGFIPTMYIPNRIDDINNVIENIDFETDCDAMNYSGSLCGACYRIVAIDSNADIYPCQCLIKANLKLTNILKKDWFTELQNSLITKEFMQLNVLRYAKCRDCSLKYICGGGCRAIALNVYKNINAHIEFLCPHQEKMAIEKLEHLIEMYG
ncbi:MAG: radical SAM protein [Clostridium sp.]|jgi:radical SAM protein with 4Fe4S-binding SPASM domain|nr:radical SAM protein [Clostridium sp.]